ncbi:MAG: hypothetical protein AB7O50_03435 [Pseudolabrys sp.]
MKKTVTAAVAAAFLIGATSAASAQLCIVGIFAAAAIVSSQDNRELTAEEAWSCGLFIAKDKDAKAKAAKDKAAKAKTAKKKVAGQNKPESKPKAN